MKKEKKNEQKEKIKKDLSIKIGFKSTSYFQMQQNIHYVVMG